MMTPGREARSLEPPRLEGETAMAYGRFIEFCRLGTQRTCAELSRRFGKSPAAFEKMGVRYRWHERVQEYDQAVDAINAEAWELQVKEAAQNRAREELVRQQRAAQLAEKMFHKVDRLLDVEFVEQVEIDGRLVLRAVSVNQLIPIAHFMKEFARISVLAVQDKIEEHNARVRKEPERTGPEAGEIIAGVFGFGGRMWGGEPMPELPQDVPAPLVAADQPRQLLPPAFGNANHSAVPTFDAMREATRGLYDREPEEE